MDYKEHYHSILQGVPEHWEKRRLGDLLKLHYGKRLHEKYRSTNQSDTAPYPVYSSGKGIFGYTDQTKGLVKTPTIILGRCGSIGNPRYISDVSKPVFPIDTVFHVTSHLNLSFIYYILSTIRFSDYAQYTVIPAIQAQIIKQIQVVVPPTEEIEAITKKLNTVVPLLDAKEEVLQNQLRLMKQMRRSLIHTLLQGKNI